MRKNFMLSLTAMAALPMAALADATWSVPADKNSVKDWTAAENTNLSSSVDEQIVGIGAGISQTLTLVKGTYEVTVGMLSNANFTIVVGDKEYISGQAFTLEADVNTVTLKVTCSDKNEAFTVGGISVRLSFDFEQAKSNLTGCLNTNVGTQLDGAAAGTWKADLSAKKTAIAGRIAALENGAADAYELYKSEELYKDSSKIQQDILYLADCIDVLTTFDDMDVVLNALTDKIAADETSQLAKDEYAQKVKNLEQAIATFKNSFDYKTQYGQLFATTKKAGWLDAVNNAKTGYKAQIVALSGDIDNANDDAAAFKHVADLIATAESNYYTYKTDLTFAGEEYATLRTKALDKLAQAYAPVVKQKDVSCTLGYRNDETKYSKIITAAEDAMSGVKNKFTDYYNDIKAEFATVAGYAKEVEGYKTVISEDNLTVEEQYENTAAQAIADAKDALEKVMKDISDESWDETYPSYSALKKAVDALELNVLLASAKSAFVAAQKAVEGMVEGEYKEADYWTEKVNSIKAFLNNNPIPSNGSVDQIRTNIKNYYYKDREAGTESGIICDYQADAQAAIDKYREVTARITDWTGKYNDVAAFAFDSPVKFGSTTYGKALSVAKATIDENQSALNTALLVENTAATSTAHKDAMAGLTALGTSYPAVLEATQADYEKDKNAYELPQTIESANSLANEVNTLAKKALKELKDAFDAYYRKGAEYGNRYTAEIWGSEANPNVEEKNFWGIRQVYYNIQGVKQDDPNKGTYTAVTTDEDADYKTATANIKTLLDDKAVFEDVISRVTDLHTAAAEIKAKFEANNNAYAEFVTACNTARTNAANIKSKNTDPSLDIVKHFEDLYDGIISRLDALEKPLGGSKENETFKADRDKEDGFQATLDAINDDITKYITEAEASAANYKDYDDLLKQIKTYLYETDGTTKKTVAAYNTIYLGYENNAGHTHFADVVTLLAEDITALEKNVNTKYSEHKASEYKEEATIEITRIKNAIAAAPADCTANDENYDKLTETGKKVEELYIKIYYKISDTDQTSKKQEWLDDLAAIETVSQEAIDKSFAAGELSTAAKYQEYDKKYSDRKAAIEQVNADWIDPSGYLDRVRAANEAEFEDLKAAYNDAVEVYLKAIAGLKPFLDYNGDDQRWNEDVAEHNAKIFDAKKALDGAYAAATEAYDNMSERNRALTPETVENAEYFDGSDWYSSTKDAQGVLQEDGLIYDARVAISNVYAKAIKALNSDTKTHLQSAIKTVEDDVDNTIGAIDTSLYAIYQGDGVKTAREKFFVKVDEALDKVTKLLDSEQLAVDYLNSKDTDEEDYDKQIEAIKTTTLPNALNALAEAQYDAWVAEKVDAICKELYVKANEKVDMGLFEQYAAIATKEDAYNGMSYKEAFETAKQTLEDKLEQFNENYTLTYEGSGMATLDRYFKTFKSTNGYDAFKLAIGKYEDSEAHYEMFISGKDAAAGDTNVNEVQSIINDNADYAPKFIVAAAKIAGVQAVLDDLKAQAEGFHATHGMGSKYNDLLSDLNDVKDAAEGLKVAINYAEKKELDAQLANLKSDYNQALNEGNKESDEMKAYHKSILTYEAALSAPMNMLDTKKDTEADKAQTDYKPTHTYDKLFAIQDSIVADRNKLAGGRVDGIYKALVANLNGLTDRYKTMAENYAKLYTYQQNAIALKADKSGELLASVNASNANHWILIEEKSLKDRIDSWTDYLDDMEPEVATALDVHDTDAEARQRLQDELNVCKTYVENMLNSERFQQYDAKNYWDSYFQSWYESFVVYNQQDIDSEPQSGRELKNDHTPLTDIDYYNYQIQRFERTCYNNEVYYRYNVDDGEYICVNTALRNLLGLLSNANILYKTTHEASYNELSRKANAAWTFFYNIHRYGSTDVDIDGNDIAYTSYDHQEFVKEVVPAVIERIEFILEEAATLEADINANTYVPGDLSGDKKVSLADFATLQSIILGKTEVDEVQKAAADLNNDTFVDISDLMLLVRQILNPAAPAPARVRVAIPHATTNDAVSVIVEGEGVHQRIGIMLDAEQAYAGCQMDITLPEGVTLAEETTGEMAGALSLLSNDLENGSHRILLSSVEGLTMATGNGALLWLDVNVDHNYNGEGIGLSNVLFANSFGRAFELSVAAGNTTGLSNVSMTQEVKEKIYNVGGILMDGLKRGVNIIRGNDGSSKKIIVK